MKKILLITQHFPPHPGGAQQYYYQLCNHLPASSIAVLADNSSNNEFARLMPEYSYPVYYRPFYFGVPFIWPKWLRLLYHVFCVIQKELPDVLWAGEPLPKGVVVYILSRVFRVPYFVTTHGADVLNPQRRKGLIGKWKTWLLKLVLNNAAFVTVNSEYTRLLVSKLGIVREQSLVVYPAPGITPPASNVTSELTRKIQAFKNKGFIILLTTCRLERRKGIESVVNALSLVFEEYKKLVYVVVGEGPERKNYELRITNQELKDRVIFTGAVSNDELSTIYNLCDIFVMLPREEDGLIEGFGIVYLEAGSFGKPVIGSKVGGVPEAIVDLYDGNYDKATGLLVDNPYNSKEVAKKILMLVKDTGLARKLGENGKRRAGEFTWQKGAEKIVNQVNRLYCT